MNEFLRYFLLAFVVFGAAALVYNIHKYGLEPTLQAIGRAAAKAEAGAVAEWSSLIHKTPSAPPALPKPPAGALSVTQHPDGTTTTIFGSGPASAPDGAQQNAANRARLAAWGAPVPDYTKITATELEPLWKQWLGFLSSGATSAMDPFSYAVSYTGGAPGAVIVNPEMELQAKFLRGTPCTETERAFVWFRDTVDPTGLFLHFTCKPDGTVVAVF